MNLGVSRRICARTIKCEREVVSVNLGDVPEDGVVTGRGEGWVKVPNQVVNLEMRRYSKASIYE